MEENYSVADEYDNREDIFEDIPEDQVEETEREIRNLRKWFDIFEKEYCDDEGLPDDDKEDAWEEESLQDDDMELYAVPEKTCESGELRGEKPESDWNEIEMDIQKSHQVRKRNLFMKKRLIWMIRNYLRFCTTIIWNMNVLKR